MMPRFRVHILVGVLLSVFVPRAYGVQQLSEAQSALHAGRYDEAIRSYSRLVRRDASSASAARGLVKALREVGRYRDATEAAQRFLDANAGSEELSTLLGEMFYATGRLEAAEQAFIRAAERASDSLTARYGLAVLWYDRGDVDRAMQAFDRFIDTYNRSATLSSEELTAVAGAVRYLGVLDPQLYKDALRAYDEAIAADTSNIEPQLLVGELFLQKYVGPEALATFESILEINPNQPRALLGLARALRFNGEPQALERARQSLEINPNLVSARVFLATLHLESEEYQRADEQIERALAVNPKSLEALALQAASRFLRGDQDGFRRTERRVLDLNPRYGDFYNTLARVSARNRLYAQAADFARRALALDSLSWSGFALLGINQLRIGQMQGGRESLERAFVGDPYDVWTKNTLDLLDNLDTYAGTNTPHFVYAIDRSESELLAPYVGEVAEQAFDRLAALYGYRPDTPLRVEVFPRHADFSVRTVGLVGLGALGVSFGPVIAMDSPSARELGDFNWGATLWHEIAHSFHLGLSRHKVPRWYTEGLAVFEERRARTGWGDGLTPGFLMAYEAGKLLPVSELNNGFMRPAYPEQLAYSYYQASLVCDLIARDHGDGALVDMLRAYGRGHTTPEALESVLGVSSERFDREFDEYMRERFADRLAVVRPPPAGDDAMGIAHMSRDAIAERAQADPRDFMAQAAMGRVLLMQDRLDEAITYLERAKALFPEYAGDDSPYRYLAEIHERRGAAREAAAELETLTRFNDRHYRARMKLAALRQSLDDRTGAAAALEEALYIYPLSVELHLELADLYAEAGRWPEAIRERQAVLALNPVDRAEALYQLANTYFDAGDFEQARRTVLQALEGAPNFQKAQELLLKLHQRRSERE